MTQFTVSVPDEVADRVSAVSRRRGVSPDEIARASRASGEVGRGDLSERAEEILRDELGA